MQSSLFEEPAPYILVVPCQMHRALSHSFAWLCPAVAQTSQSLSSFAASGSTNPDWPCSTPATDSLYLSYDVAQSWYHLLCIAASSLYACTVEGFNSI